MAGPKGCLKSCLIGCGGLIGLVVLLGAIMAGLAWHGLGRGGQVERNLTAGADQLSGGAVVDESMTERAARLTTTRGGTVTLTLSEGDFALYAAPPGQGLHATATFDSEVHHLSEQFTVLPDSTWEYALEFRQSMPGLQSLFRNLLGGKTDAKVRVYLPPEVPIDLVVRAQRGGCEADLGGLWLRNADVQFQQGGIELEFSSPLREPMDSLRLYSRMGGMSAGRVGNASPRLLDIDCAMGGGDIDLRGLWRGDCDARASIRMGGMSLKVPANLRVEGDGATAPPLRTGEIEVAGPVLRLQVEQKMGEVEVLR